MVTKILVRIPIPGKKTASASAAAVEAEESNQSHDYKQNGDDYCNSVQEQANKNDSLFCSTKGCLYEKAANGSSCDGNLCHDVHLQGKPNDDRVANRNEVDSCQQNDDASKKRPLLMNDADDTSEEKTKRQKGSKLIDLSDVPPLLPIISSTIDSSSQYKGVTFDTSTNKWMAHIEIDGNNHCIGWYDDEEEAGIDYARAIFKYKTAKRKAIDLTGVPPQPLILRGVGNNGASKYLGVTFSKTTRKWQAKIAIDGKNHTIGYYDNEEEAAAVYARAIFKYKSDGPKTKKFIDLSDVPPLLPIISSKIDSSSKYKGVTFDTSTNKWMAHIEIDGKNHNIGYYDNEEEAGIDYARAIFKYKTAKRKAIDLSDVPSQPLILRGVGNNGASKYLGVTFNKANNKWLAQITFDGKNHTIGWYDNEEEAAAVYARAALKYKNKKEEKVVHRFV